VQTIAYGALLLWPVVALGLFMLLPAGRATIWTLLAGYLLLPISTAFDYSGVPALDKSSIPSLVALFLALLVARKGEFRWPRSKTVNLLMLLYCLVPFFTGINNSDPIVIGSVTLPALGFWEGLSNAVGNAIEVIPFVLGAALLSNDRAHRELLWAFVVAGLAYSLPILFELRMSPILQGKIYGVSQIGYFLQQMRGGGFRSMVFLGHGLLVSTFLAMALIAAIGLWRMRVTLFSLPMILFVLYLAGVLVLNKSVAAVALVVLLAPALIFLRSRQFISIAFALSLVIISYPLVRSANILPLQSVAESIRPFAPDRAESMRFRLDNEDLLLNRASQKPFFGWGSYGRNRVIVVTTWGATTDVSVTDGTWVIMIGIYGWLGYLTCFGLLTYPFWHAFRMRKMGLPVATVSLAAMLILNLLDLVPNSSLRPITWLIAGALAGMSAASLHLAPRARRGVPGARQVPSFQKPAAQT
jgi:hypothetical protein